MTLRERKVLDPSGEPIEAVPVRRQLPVPWVAGSVVAISAIAFLIDRLITLEQTPFLVWKLGALYGPAVTDGQWWRVLSTIFIHGSPNDFGMSVMHIGFNMWVVVTLGFMLERVIGSGRMLIISLATAIGASAFALHFNYDVPTVGASGMILGWAGAILPIATQQGRRSIGTWLVQVAVLSLIPGVSWSAHLGGFLLGIPCGLALRGGKRFWAIAPLVLVASVALAYAAGTHPPPQTQSTSFHA
jgi:rhomboid protease GluP